MKNISKSLIVIIALSFVLAACGSGGGSSGGSKTTGRVEIGLSCDGVTTSPTYAHSCNEQWWHVTPDEVTNAYATWDAQCRALATTTHTTTPGRGCPSGVIGRCTRPPGTNGDIWMDIYYSPMTANDLTLAQNKCLIIGGTWSTN
jgi:hypothetical protein